ncbi:MAG: IS30 family transposase [Gammaproteobacteria bacterium]|nr:IS30 family transposase [Gammaproteobacteria bacterium]MDH3553378.1 IS30 family transposase [Gammaproteobacteria bacterium]
MNYPKRIYYTEADKALMWDRWQRGESLHSIAQHFGRSHSSIQGILSRTGGIRPPARHRAATALSLVEREEISRGIASGLSLRRIASGLGRAPSTISRELNRNGGRRRYRAHAADQAAWDRARRPKRCKLVLNRPLARTVARLLRQRWSPWQIAGRLKREYAHDESSRVSHETIYKTLFIQARGALKKELVQQLRRRRGMRRSRHHTQKTPDHGRIVGAVSIRERPAEVEERAVPGHWEGDLLFGSNGSQIATLVERQSRYCMLVRVGSKDTETVINALIKHAHKLPRELYRSLTWDRGKEMADHQRFSLATDIKVYFCDPQHPWQRGSNEQINGLLRQYFPKGTDLSGIHQNRLNAVARQLNERPRETLEFETPAERFAQCVASTN